MKDRDIIAVLHNVRSVHNVGSIFRTADAAGVRKIYCAGITPAPLDRFGRPRADLAKVALGAEKNVAWEAARSTAALLARLRKDGYALLALEQDKHSIPYDKIPVAIRRRKLCLVLGDEVRGLPRSLLARADRVLEIPMRGKKESLNVAVAFGIAAYALTNN